MPEWTCEVIAQMHRYEITSNELAEACGYTKSYLSLVLNGKRSSSRAKVRVSNALILLVAQKQAMRYGA